MESINLASKLAEYGLTGVAIACILLCAFLAWIIYRQFQYQKDMVSYLGNIIDKNTAANTKLNDTVDRLCSIINKQI